MTSSKDKGNANARKARAIFNDQGFTVWKAAPSSKFIPCKICNKRGCARCQGKGGFWIGQSQDILEAFDFEAHRKDCKILYVQVTTLSEGNEDSLARERKRKAADLDLNEQHLVRIVMGYRPGGAWSLWAYNERYGWRRFDSQKVGRKYLLDLDLILHELGALEGKVVVKQARLG